MGRVFIERTYQPQERKEKKSFSHPFSIEVKLLAYRVVVRGSRKKTLYTMGGESAYSKGTLAPEENESVARSIYKKNETLQSE